jgi:aminoglycoside phosphotransferase family enzyme
MNREQIDRLMADVSVQPAGCQPRLIETHISWVIMTGGFAYKIKKPMQYSFLDFSTLEKRKFYCERELVLNRRLTEEVYLGVLPIFSTEERISIGSIHGEVIDYAVKMKEMEPGRRMDILLKEDKVGYSDIGRLVEKIAGFHHRTEIIPNKDIMDIPLKFADLANEREFLSGYLPVAAYIPWAVHASLSFIERHWKLVAARQEEGLTRDCHGDLHTRNIFLLNDPQPFDCIDFNDDLRQIDVLNEVAFLCMDLDASGRRDLSAIFLIRYNELFPVVRTKEEEKLFLYFESYRANVRAKVNSYRARTAVTLDERDAALRQAEKYLWLMKEYLEQLQVA